MITGWPLPPWRTERIKSGSTPGNIGSRERIQAVVDVARERDIPIRVGVNSGSLEKELVEKYHGVTAEGIVESALDKVRIIEELGYDKPGDQY